MHTGDLSHSMSEFYQESVGHTGSDCDDAKSLPIIGSLQALVGVQVAFRRIHFDCYDSFLQYQKRPLACEQNISVNLPPKQGVSKKTLQCQSLVPATRTLNLLSSFSAPSSSFKQYYCIVEGGEPTVLHHLLVTKSQT